MQETNERGASSALRTRSRPRASALSASDESRLARMMTEHRGLVCRILRRYGVELSRADDATQDVFIIAARKLDLIKPGCERQYVSGVATRVAANYRRARATRAEVSDDARLFEEEDLAPAADHLLDYRRTGELLNRILLSMSLDLRTVFVSFELEGKTMPEIAALSGTPVGTVASRLRRARELFEKALQRAVRRQAAQTRVSPLCSPVPAGAHRGS